MTRRLTLKQEKFVHEYSKCGNGIQAARAAGYNGSDGSLAVIASNALKLPNVSAALAKLRAAAVKATIASREERLEILTSFVRSAAEETKDRIKAAELIAKMQGDCMAKIEHSGPGGAPIQLQAVTMPPQEAALLLAKIQEEKERRD